MKAYKTLFGVLLALLLAAPVFAQTATTATTLSAAVSSTSQDRITVASATGFAAGRFVYIDNELMQVARTYSSGTTIPVVRAKGGRASKHLSGARVLAGITGSYDPTLGQSSGVFIVASPYGPCTPGNQQYTIVVNTTTGDKFKCIGDTWVLIEGPNQKLKTVSAEARTAAIATVDTTFFVADRPYMVVAVTEIHNTIEDSAGGWQIAKDTSTDAPGAGTDLLTAVIDLTATTRVVQTPTLTSTTSALHLKAGDRLAWDASATLDTVVNVVVTVHLMPE